MSKGVTIMKEMDLSFNELVTAIRSLPRTQKMRLREVLDHDIAPSRNSDERLLHCVVAALGEELNRPTTSAHRAVIAHARRQHRDENAGSADCMVEVQRKTYHRLNPRRSKKG